MPEGIQTTPKDPSNNTDRPDHAHEEVPSAGPSPEAHELTDQIIKEAETELGTPDVPEDDTEQAANSTPININRRRFLGLGAAAVAATALAGLPTVAEAASCNSACRRRVARHIDRRKREVRGKPQMKMTGPVSCAKTDKQMNHSAAKCRREKTTLKRAARASSKNYEAYLKKCGDCAVIKDTFMRNWKVCIENKWL